MVDDPFSPQSHKGADEGDDYFGAADESNPFGDDDDGVQDNDPIGAGDDNPFGGTNTRSNGHQDGVWGDNAEGQHTSAERTNDDANPFEANNHRTAASSGVMSRGGDKNARGASLPPRDQMYDKFPICGRTLSLDVGSLCLNEVRKVASGCVCDIKHAVVLDAMST